MSRRWVGVTASIATRRVLTDLGPFLVTLAFYFVVTSVISALWRGAAGTNGGSVVGYSAIALTWYLAASEAATVSLNPRLIEEIGDDIASGSVAAELLRPVSVLGVRVASQVGRTSARLAGCMAVGALLSWVVAGPPVSGLGVALAVPSLVLAVICNIALQHAFAAAAFWIRDTRSTWLLYHKLVFMVGGMLMPLEAMPDGFAAVARLLPFAAMAYAPGRFAAGFVEWHLLLVQVAWIAVLGAAAVAIFAAGERKLQTVGG